MTDAPTPTPDPAEPTGKPTAEPTAESTGESPAEPTGEPGRPVATMTAAQAERAGRRTRDVVLSMAALLVPIFVLLAGYKIFFNGDKPMSFDVSETYQTARHGGAFPVLEPTALPDGWSANTATYTPAATPAPTGGAAAGATLRVVYHSPDGSGMQLVESSGPADAVLIAELGDAAKPGNLITVNGAQWREYPQLPVGGRALVNVADGRTTVLLGDADAAELRAFAAALG